MTSHTHKVEAQIGRHTLIIESGELAKQAGGAVTVTYGGTVSLATAVAARGVNHEKDFFPLTVDYRERTYAAGRIPGGFFKREGRPSEKEILTARLIDRPIRPLFPTGFLNEVQVMVTVLSSDGENDPDLLGVIGGSAALAISNIPFLGPLGVVKVGRINGDLIICPTYKESEEGELDIIIAGTKEGILMIESGCKEISENELADALEAGYHQVLKVLELQQKLVALCGKPKFKPKLLEIPRELKEKITKIALPRLEEAHRLSSKEEREEAVAVLTDELVEQFADEGIGYTANQVKFALSEVEQEKVRDFVLNQKARVDGRKFDQLRSIHCQIGALPRTHGSSVFTRGQTQSLSVTTLGTSADEQTIDALEGKSSKNFMLHYNFPPFSVGEVGPTRGPGRREIGHGALAERALKMIIPTKEKFPYTIRIVSDILESNGSSSMATVCAGSLSLMDAGVPISSHVSGIALGLVKEKDRYAILTDIAGVEDHYGDMDFKVAGSRKGVTALQLDVKLQDGITLKIIREALEQGKKARAEIMEIMQKTIAAPRAELSKYAPRITTFKINPEKIRDVIGPGGKVIRKIIEETGAMIDVEDDGMIAVASSDSVKVERAIQMIRDLTEEVEVGKTYTGKIKRILNFGAFCEILPGKEGLIHISELEDKHVAKVEDVVKVGDEVKVKVIQIDELGRVNLSRKQALSS
jgi:polyribonucleotide nucleotidyltransferase